MPAEMEHALKEEAMKKFGTIDSPAARAYIYGTLSKYEKAHKAKMMEKEKKK